MRWSLESRTLFAGLVAVLELCSGAALWAAQLRVLLAPNATDPAITRFNHNPCAIVDPALTARAKLPWFLPGTGATPVLHRDFPQDAASLGFHLPGLMYPNGDAINVLWTNLIVSGHPHGAGMAAVLTKSRRVDCCVMFTDMDWWVAGNRPHNWMSATPPTPADRWLLLAHARDQCLDFIEMLTNAPALDLTRHGGHVRAETSASRSCFHRHLLSTDLDPAPARATGYRGCPVVDTATRFTRPASRQCSSRCGTTCRCIGQPPSPLRRPLRTSPPPARRAPCSDP